MAWEDLLKKHEAGGESPPPEEEQERIGLIRQAGRLIGQAGPAPLETEGPAKAVRYPDGYVRRSPVQTYRTAKDLGRRRLRRAAAALLLLACAVLVLLALMKSGLLVFRFR